MTTKCVKILWKTDGENHRKSAVYCDFCMPFGVHFGDQGQHKKRKIKMFLLVTFSGVGSGKVLGCFLEVLSMLSGTLFVAFW